jgi:hypothetical protein
MSARQRRKRANGEAEGAGKEESTEEWSKGDKKVMFMEEVNYKMEMEDTNANGKQVLLGQDPFSEE